MAGGSLYKQHGRQDMRKQRVETLFPVANGCNVGIRTVSSSGAVRWYVLEEFAPLARTGSDPIVYGDVP
eukprot:scaffold41844_cov46-Cyclotella_meneghiniana.AAC.6